MPAPITFASSIAASNNAQILQYADAALSLVTIGNCRAIVITSSHAPTVTLQDTTLSAAPSPPVMSQVIQSWGGSGSRGFQVSTELKDSSNGTIYAPSGTLFTNVAALNTAIRSTAGFATDNYTSNFAQTSTNEPSGQLQAIWVTIMTPSGNAGSFVFLVSLRVVGVSAASGQIGPIGNASAIQQQPSSVVIQRRRSVAMRIQSDMSDQGLMLTQPIQDVGWIIGPGNPSIVDSYTPSVTGCNATPDADIDLQDGQYVFSQIGTFFTGTGGGA